MSSFIHTTAVVAPGAKISDGCHIGPFCTVGDEVQLGDRVRLESHVVVDGITRIGSDTVVFPFATLGLAPQDLKYKGEQTRTEVGERNQIREGVTIHRGTAGGGGVTRIGNDNLLMAQVHVAHDCNVGNNVILGNGTALAGHVTVADRVNIGAFTGVHQFSRIGREAFIGGYSVIVKDPLPYSLCHGNHARCFGENRVGLRRRGYPKETRDKIHRAFRLLLSSRLNTSQALERIRQEIVGCEEVDHILEFIESSGRGVIK